VDGVAYSKAITIGNISDTNDALIIGAHPNSGYYKGTWTKSASPSGDGHRSA